MTLTELYAIYGELLIQAEITQAKINEVKRNIANEMNSGKVIPANELPISGTQEKTKK